MQRPHGPCISRLLFNSHPVSVTKLFPEALIQLTDRFFGNVVGIRNGQTLMQSLLSKVVHGGLLPDGFFSLRFIPRNIGKMNQPINSAIKTNEDSSKGSKKSAVVIQLEQDCQYQHIQ